MTICKLSQSRETAGERSKNFKALLKVEVNKDVKNNDIFQDIISIAWRTGLLMHCRNPKMYVKEITLIKKTSFQHHVP
jgi:hypothetical protein